MIFALFSLSAGPSRIQHMLPVLSSKPILAHWVPELKRKMRPRERVTQSKVRASTLHLRTAVFLLGSLSLQGSVL